MGDRQHAIELYNKGVEAVQNKELQHAYQSHVSSIYADPTFGLGWYALGNDNSDLNFLPASVSCWRRALECELTDEEKARVLCNLSWRLHCLNESEEAYDYALQATKLDPDLELGWLCLSQIEQLWGHSKFAVELAEKCYAASPNSAEGRFNLAFALLFDKQWSRGLKEFEVRFPHRLKQFMHYPYPPWRGEPDKVVFLVSEQGLGDAISFARFVEQACARAKYVHACIQPELMRLFQHAFMHIKNLNLIPAPAHFPPADYWTTFVSLPHALGLSDEEIEQAKQIEPPVYSLPKSWLVENRKIHIGIAWRGSKLNEINEHRSIPVEQFLELYKVPGVQLYSLQVDENRKQMHDIGGAGLIQDLASYVRDVCDTVALMQHLDLIITCESALGHIAALANKECWIAYSWQGRDYRLGLKGETKLWTPKHKVFQQDRRATWQPVFERISAAVSERLSSGSNAAQPKQSA